MLVTALFLKTQASESCWKVGAIAEAILTLRKALTAFSFSFRGATLESLLFVSKLGKMEVASPQPLYRPQCAFYSLQALELEGDGKLCPPECKRLENSLKHTSLVPLLPLVRQMFETMQKPDKTVCQRQRWNVYIPQP